MRFLTRDPLGYWNLLKPAVVVFCVIGILRFLAGPLGIPIRLAGLMLSLTLALLLFLIGYGIYLGLRQSGFGDLLVSVLILLVAYDVVLFTGLLISFYGGVDTYFLAPAHVGPNPNIPVHLGAHLRVTPIQYAMGVVIMTLAWGITLGVRRLTVRQAPRAS